MKILCKLFNHNWKYYETGMLAPSEYFRYCKRCESLEKYRKDIPAFSSGWFRMIQRTKKGGEELLKRFEGE